MLRLLTSNNKGPSLLISKNESGKNTAAKHLPLYYTATKALRNSDSPIFGPSIIIARNCKSKRTNRNKDNSKMIVKSSLSYYAVTKKLDGSDPLLLVPWVESIYNRKNKWSNTENENNRWDWITLYIRIIEDQLLRKNCKIITKNESDENNKDKISNPIGENIERKELGTINSRIKVHIPRSLILPNSSSINSTKQKLPLSPVLLILDLIKYNPQSFSGQNKPEEDQYLPSFSANNQFVINAKSDNKDNHAIAKIKGLFLNIGHRLFYKKLIEKAVYKTCKFFIHSIRHISSKD